MNVWCSNKGLQVDTELFEDAEFLSVIFFGVCLTNIKGVGLRVLLLNAAN